MQKTLDSFRMFPKSLVPKGKCPGQSGQCLTAFEIYLCRDFAAVYFVQHFRSQLYLPQDSQTLASGPTDPYVIEKG